MSFFMYTIQSGDTLDTISSKCTVPADTLYSDNKDNKDAVHDKNTIITGKQLKIRVTQYTFKQGEDPTKVATKAGSPVTANGILFVNPGVSATQFLAGKQYNVPGTVKLT